ncbi:MAG: hypothetical protein H0X38_18550 [Planctomycetes bacterium]|jgi:hypothetical protein|nr:hypothetical protein [Planctomycetota bacterium]
MQRLIPALTLLAIATGGALTATAAEDLPSIHDLFVGVLLTPVPKIHEETHDSANTAIATDWRDQDSNGFGVSVVSLNCSMTHDWGGIMWGGELVTTKADITANTLLESGSLPAYRNPSTERMQYQTLGANLLVGYEYGIAALEEDEFGGWVEVLAVLGGGGVRADSEDRLNHTVVQRKGGDGVYYNYGLRLAGFLTERRWIFGASVEWLAGTAQVDIDYGGSASTKMTIDQNGLGFAFLAGYRF